MMKKIIGIIICILLITTTGSSVVGIKEERNELNKSYEGIILEEPPLPTGLFDWPMFRYGLNNLGYSPSLAPDDNALLWSKEFTYEIKSNPTIYDDKIYIVDNTQDPLGRGGDIYCLDAFTGEEIWKMDQWDDEVWGSPTVAEDKVFALGIAYNLYCYNASTGELLWEYEANGHCSPMVLDNKVYFGINIEGGFYCLNATTGDKIWEFDTETNYEGCTPAIVNGKVYIGNNNDIFYCLDADTGDEIWNYSVGGSIWSSPSFYDDKVYFASDKLYCLNAYNGDEIWTVSGIATSCSPAIAYDNVFIGSSGKIHCVDAETGDEIWQSSPLGTTIWNAHAVADYKLYTCSNGDPARFNCLDVDNGEIIWQYIFSSSYSYSSPAVAYGNVYVGSGDDKTLYAFGTPNEPPDAPVKPDGPNEGEWYVEYTFNSSTTDPEGNTIHYLFDWDDGLNSGWLGPYASGDTVSATHIWTKGGNYEIRVKAHDGRRESNWSEALSIIIENHPPNEPRNPIPPNGTTYVNINTTISWYCNDPDGDDLTFDVYFGTSSPPLKVSSNQSNVTYDPGILDFDTSYYWKIVAWDEFNYSTDGPIWSFTTEENVPPYEPNNPNPQDGATDVTIYKILNWTGGDPNVGDPVTYDVYLGTNSPPPLVAEDLTNGSYDPGIMDLDTTYYWQIISEDSGGLISEGQIWSFTTEEVPNEPPTAPSIDGPDKGKPGAELCWTFHSDDPNNNDVKYIINWGDGNSEGTDYYPSCTPAEVCHTYDEEGTYIIKAIAEDIKEARSDESTFEVEIPRTRTSTYHIWFEWLSDRFLLLEKLLTFLLL